MFKKYLCLEYLLRVFYYYFHCILNKNKSRDAVTKIAFSNNDYSLKIKLRLHRFIHESVFAPYQKIFIIQTKKGFMH